jgi:hypothetical protein
MPFYELQPDRKPLRTYWRLPKRHRSCSHIYSNILKKIFAIDSIGFWSQPRFTLSVVDRMIPVNESPVIRSVPVAQI